MPQFTTLEKSDQQPNTLSGTKSRKPHPFAWVGAMRAKSGTNARLLATHTHTDMHTNTQRHTCRLAADVAREARMLASTRASSALLPTSHANTTICIQQPSIGGTPPSRGTPASLPACKSTQAGMWAWEAPANSRLLSVAEGDEGLHQVMCCRSKPWSSRSHGGSLGQSRTQF